MAQAEAVIVRIIRQKFRIALRPGDPRELAKDAEDTAGQARLKLLKRLRSAGSPDEIRDIDDYAALAAQTAYVDFLREKYRNWFGLRDRLRYLLDVCIYFDRWH